MPARLADNDVRLLDEVRAYLRAESTPRKLWRRRTWLGRRWAFRLVEAAILANGHLHNGMRINDDLRHAFAEMILDALESAGALDLFSAGRNAEETLDDPTDGTRRLQLRERGQEAPEEDEHPIEKGRRILRRRPAR